MCGDGRGTAAPGPCHYRVVRRAEFEISTDRLKLRPWRSSDAADFATMNADVDVMADLGGPLTRGASDDKLDRFRKRSPCTGSLAGS